MGAALESLSKDVDPQSSTECHGETEFVIDADAELRLFRTFDTSSVLDV